MGFRGTVQVNSVDKKFKILIADRNRNVRNFLQRELLDEGYQVILAAEGRELLQLLQSKNPPDLLILDPDIPSSFPKPELIKFVHSRDSALPIVIHTFWSDDSNYQNMPGVALCLEKGEDIGELKKAVAEVLHKYYQLCQSI
jgi:DNA-binding NtrC family response regulator